MIMSDQQQQVTEKYLFTITPLEITSNSKLRSNSRKSLLIKLGNQTAKCSTLLTPVHLEVEVLYSRTLQKYCPLKGIIKIYDVAEDGSQIISCVGGFQTDELLNQSKSQVLLEKEIGTSRLKMEISITNKGTTTSKGSPGASKPQVEKEDKRSEPNKEDKRGPPKDDIRRSWLPEDKKDAKPATAVRPLSRLEGLGSIKRVSPMPRMGQNGSSSGRYLDRSKNKLNLQSLQASRNMFEQEQNKKQLTILKKLAGEKDKKIVSLQRQIEGLDMTIRNLRETNKHLTEENHYLREKNQKVELSLYHKESMIASLNQQADKLGLELQELDGRLYNSSLEIEELKEEVSNCMETIQKYREKYGDLKGVKNRAIEMEIKDCLRWIQMQNRDLEMSQFEETTPSEHSEDREASLSSVIRSMEIEKMPKEEMSIIRKELIKILEKVDQMMSG